MPRILSSALNLGNAAGQGVNVMDWSDNSSLQNQQGTAALVTAADGPAVPGRTVTKYLRLTQAAATSFGQCDRSLNVGNLAFSPHTGIGLWVRNPGSRSLQFEVRVYDSTAARSISYNFACRPTGRNWIFLAATRNQVLADTILSTDVYRFVRITQGAGDFPWVAGDVCEFGPVFLNPRGRPKFVICTDDGFTANVVNGTGFPTGYPASGGNYLAICNFYGFKASAAIITGQVGNPGRMTWAQIQTLKDAGWSILNHATADHVGSGTQGMTYLTKQQMIDDLTAARAALDAQGYRDTSNLFQLPQGAWNEDLREACSTVGMLFVGGVGSTAITNRGGTIGVGFPSGGGRSNAVGMPTVGNGFPSMASRIQIDGAPVLADVQTYIDELIRYGASGGCYTHSIDATIATLFDGMCTYLQRKQRAGEIDVVTVAQYVSQHDGSRARAP